MLTFSSHSVSSACVVDCKLTAMSALCCTTSIAPNEVLGTNRDKLRFIAWESCMKQILQTIRGCFFILLLFLCCCRWYDTGERHRRNWLEIPGLKKETNVFCKTVAIWFHRRWRKKKNPYVLVSHALLYILQGRMYHVHWVGDILHF